MSMRRLSPHVVIFALLGLLIVGLPFIFMSLANPQAIPVTSLAQGGTGTYVGREPDLMKIFPRASLEDTVPAEAPVVGSDARVYVKARQMNEVTTYTLADFADGRLLEVRRTLLSATTLEIAPEHELAAGAYVASVPRSDPYGATDYFYFVVASDASR
jgi:hypothetical protein